MRLDPTVFSALVPSAVSPLDQDLPIQDVLYVLPGTGTRGGYYLHNDDPDDDIRLRPILDHLPTAAPAPAKGSHPLCIDCVPALSVDGTSIERPSENMARTRVIPRSDSNRRIRQDLTQTKHRSLAVAQPMREEVTDDAGDILSHRIAGPDDLPNRLQLTAAGCVVVGGLDLDAKSTFLHRLETMQNEASDGWDTLYLPYGEREGGFPVTDESLISIMTGIAHLALGTTKDLLIMIDALTVEGIIGSGPSTEGGLQSGLLALVAHLGWIANAGWHRTGFRTVILAALNPQDERYVFPFLRRTNTFGLGLIRTFGVTASDDAVSYIDWVSTIGGHGNDRRMRNGALPLVTE